MDLNINCESSIYNATTPSVSESYKEITSGNFRRCHICTVTRRWLALSLYRFSLKEGGCLTKLACKVLDEVPHTLLLDPTADPRLIQLVISTGYCINDKDELGMTPLAIYIGLEPELLNRIDRAYDKYGKGKNIVQAMCKAGADINATNRDGQTALHITARNNKVEIVKKLIEARADHTMLDPDGNLPIHCCINHSDAASRSSIFYLLKANHSDLICVKNKQGKTFLELAIENNKYGAVDMIIKCKSINNSCFDKPIVDGLDSVQLALRSYSHSVVNVLRKGEVGWWSTNKNNDKFKPIRNWLNKGHIMQIIHAYNRWVENETVKEMKSTLLHEAVLNSNDENFENNLYQMKVLFTHYKFDVNAKNHEGKTVLHLAMVNSKPEFALALMKTKVGVDLNVQDKDLNTPLHAAITAGNTQLALTLIDKDGIKLNLKNKEGNTPMHLAAIKGDIKVKEALINKSVQLTLQNKAGTTANTLLKSYHKNQ